MMRFAKLLLVGSLLVLACFAFGMLQERMQVFSPGLAPYAAAENTTGNQTNMTDDDTNGTPVDDDYNPPEGGDDDDTSDGDSDKGDDDNALGDDDAPMSDEGGDKSGAGPISASFFTSPLVIGATLFLVAAFIVLIVIALAYTKMKHDELLNHAMRKRIYDHISGHQGQHFRNIMTDLALPSGVLTHHINMLEREDYIKSVQDGIYRRFYTYDAQKDPRHLLTQHQQNILKVIQAQPGISQSDIANQLGITRMLVNYHLKILSAEHLVRIETKGRASACFPMAENT